MDRLDREIMKEILTTEKSIYSVNEALKKRGEESNYATVWRHIKKMQKNGLLTTTKAPRKNGKPDKRETKMAILTPKGVATVLIEGDLQEVELVSIGKKFFLEAFGEELVILIEPVIASIFSDALLRIKPKVNLKFFDEKYFDELFEASFVESLIENLPKINLSLDPKKLQKLYTHLRKVAKKQGTLQTFDAGFEFGRALRSKKDKGE